MPAAFVHDGTDHSATWLSQNVALNRWLSTILFTKDTTIWLLKKFNGYQRPFGLQTKRGVQVAVQKQTAQLGIDIQNEIGPFYLPQSIKQKQK